VISDRIKGFVLPITVLVALEIWARTVDLHSDSLAPPSAIVVAFGSAFGDGAFLSATRDTLASAFAGFSSVAPSV
jgi:ABC-type nitrate/sulfonate/bicarbonate transport system permease component